MTDIYIIASWYPGEGAPNIEVCMETIDLAGAAFEAGEAGKTIRIIHVFEMDDGTVRSADVTRTWKKKHES